jgi:hypothetical protein
MDGGFCNRLIDNQFDLPFPLPAGAHRLAVQFCTPHTKPKELFQIVNLTNCQVSLSRELQQRSLVSPLHIGASPANPVSLATCSGLSVGRLNLLADTPDLLLKALTSGLSARDPAAVESTCRFFRSPVTFSPDASMPLTVVSCTCKSDAWMSIEY